jgi:hypothetical protein
VSDRTGRLDLLVKDGLGQIADRFGVRGAAQSAIDRFVDERVTRERIPVTLEEMLERIGILKPRPKLPGGQE